MIAHLLWAFFVLTVAFLVVFLRARASRRANDPAVRAALDQLGDEVAVFDTSGAVVRSNSSWRASGFEDSALAARWLQECLAGAKPVSGILRKQGGLVVVGLSPLIDQFGDLIGGVAVMSPARGFEQRSREAGLTPRELELVVSVLQGRTYKEASLDLGIGETTVKAHLQNVFRKTGCRSRHELAALFMPAS